MAASPCALAIATPSAVLSGIAQAARNGVLIKGGVRLENLGALSIIAFEKLRRLGVKSLTVLTGDKERVAATIAGQVGLTQFQDNLLPEAKVEVIKGLLDAHGRVAMVGDGVNDAPALATSTVGIAMGAGGTDVALETADEALMADDLSWLPFAVGLSRASRRIVLQNLVASLGVIALLLPAALTGAAGIGIAVVLHEVSTLLVVGNALRLLGYSQA